MPNQQEHIHQASYNHSIAGKLISDPKTYDWGLVVAFYTAIHYVEAGLRALSIQQPNDRLESLHTWRLRMVKEKFGDECYKEYDELKFVSENVRYLRARRKFGSIPSQTYYTPTDAQDWFDRRLPKIKNFIQSKCKISLP